MKSSQEFVIETGKGTKFRMEIAKQESGRFRVNYSETPNGTNLEVGQIKKLTSGEFFTKVDTAFKQMIEWVNIRLKGNDTIKCLDNPGDCDLISPEQQKKMVTRLSYYYSVIFMLNSFALATAFFL